MKQRIDGYFVFVLMMGIFVLLCLIGGVELPPNLQIATNLAGYTTLALICVLLVGHFQPNLLRWAETALQDIWGGKGTDGRSVGQDEGGMEEGPVPTAAVARSMGYAVGFLLLTFIFGLYLVPPIYLATYLILDAKAPPRWAVVAGIVATVILIGGMQAVNVEVWAGIMPEIIPGYLGGAFLPPI